MISILEGETFLLIWIGFLLLMTGGIAVFFLWGIRAGQFSDQDRARYLPLQCDMPPAPPPLASEDGIIAAALKDPVDRAEREDEPKEVPAAEGKVGGAP